MPFELTILGSNSAIPTAHRYPTAQVLNVLGRFFLIDCGEGTQIQLRKNRIGFNKISRIFISHLHGDHYYGLIGLLSTMKLMGRREELHIYAPGQLQALLQPQIDIMSDGLGYPLYYHHLNFSEKEKIFTDKKLEICSFPVKHSVPTCGFLFKELPKKRNIKKELIIKYDISIPQIKRIKEGEGLIMDDGTTIPNHKLTTPPKKPRTYAFCTDTKYNEDIIEFIKGVDLLYHEATFTEELKEMAKKTMHSTAKEAATIALKANVKQLMIGHFSARYDQLNPILEEAKAIFDNTVLAIEGEKHIIKSNEAKTK